MSRFTVLHSCVESRRLGLFDGYGKCHVACVTDGLLAAVGDRFHGSNPALGLHFLVTAESGHRVSANFESVHVSRETMFAIFDHLLSRPRHCRPSQAWQQVLA